MIRAIAAVLALAAGCGVSIGGQPARDQSVDGGGGGVTPGSGSNGTQPGSGNAGPVDAGSPPVVDAPSGSTTLSPRTFIDRIGEKLCNEAFKCESSFPGSQNQFDNEFGQSTTDCYPILDVDLEGAGVASEVSNGNIAYDPDSAVTCLAGITYGSCSNFWQNGATFPDACSAALVGSAQEGDACVVDLDCAGADVCDNSGTCVPPPQ